jgi:hypothetical protein
MTAYSVTKKRLFEGVWEGIVTADSDNAQDPILDVTHQEKPLENVHLAEADKGWTLRIPIPPAMIADGVQTILINDKISGETLDVISIVAGEALAEDIRPEMDLLRAELDMLKRAFRRHCLETMS